MEDCWVLFFNYYSPLLISAFVTGLSAEVYIRPDPGFTPVSDVVFFGLNIIIPLITTGLLRVPPAYIFLFLSFFSDIGVLAQFPELCLQYFKLIVFMIEIYSEKLVGLPQSLFQSLMKSLEFGVEQ